MLIGQWKVKPYYKFPADGWIGYFWDSRQRNLYIGIPFVGLKFHKQIERPQLESPKPVEKKGEVSEEFYRAFTYSGTCVATCEFCGVTHFATGDGSMGYEENELEELKDKAEKEPAKYHEWGDSGSIGVFHLAGKQGIMDCPCNGVYVYESFIWEYKNQIADYIVAKTRSELNDAKLASDLVSGLTDEQLRS